MNKTLQSLGISLGAAMLVGLAGCGSVDQAAGAVETLQPVGPREYATIPPVTAPPTTAPPTQPQPGEVTTIEVLHVVSANESLPLIAAAYQIDLTVLLGYNAFEANKVVNPGDRIRIPAGATMPTGPISSAAGATDPAAAQGGSAEANTGSGDTAETAAPEGSGCTYTIAGGDNPTKVANKVGIPVKDLLDANQSSGVLLNFLVGDKLVIPPPGNC